MQGKGKRRHRAFARGAPLLPLLALASGLAVGAAADPVATQVESVSIDPAGFATVSASCAAGEVPVGGGTGPEDRAFVKLTEVAPGFGDAPAFQADAGAGPAPDVWFSSAVNGHPVEAQVQRTGAVCADAAVPTSSVVEKATVAGESFDVLVADCPPGSVAVGGGPSPEDVADVFVTRTAPELEQRLVNTPDGPAPAPTGWNSAVRNQDTQDHGWAAVAVCQERSDVTTVVASEQVEAGPTSTASVRADCPSGARAIGGGVDSQNTLDVTVTGSEPVVDGSPLFFSDDGRQSAPTAWIAHVHNGTEFPQTFKVGVVCVPEPGDRALGSAALLSLTALRLGAVRRGAGARRRGADPPGRAPPSAPSS